MEQGETLTFTGKGKVLNSIATQFNVKKYSDVKFDISKQLSTIGVNELKQIEEKSKFHHGFDALVNTLSMHYHHQNNYKLSWTCKKLHCKVEPDRFIG